MGKAAEDTIVRELKEAKYFSISLDLTPDIAHTDQLCFTVRYSEVCQANRACGKVSSISANGEPYCSANFQQPGTVHQ